MKKTIILTTTAVSALLTANCLPFIVSRRLYGLIPLALLLLAVQNLLPLFAYVGPKSKILRACLHGVICLEAFCIALVPTVAYQLIFTVKNLTTSVALTLSSLLVATISLALIFWNGIICVYMFSVQLGVTYRLRGILLGLVPIANLVMLVNIIRTVEAEIRYEAEKLRLNETRRDKRVCATMYPILFVHGVCFRDYSFPNYWGRIPAELEKNGAKVFFGNHASASSVCSSALELAARIRYITDDLGYGKVNIIAHSKGGLDCRFAICNFGVADKVASLITVNTPHRGCLYADHLLGKIPEVVKNRVATAYNTVLKRLGDDDPDFLAAMGDLTKEGSARLDREIGDESKYQGIYRLSIGSKINEKRGAKLPFTLTHGIVRRFDGENDGLVAVDSFNWGDEYRFVESTSRRGISHLDIVDMVWENRSEFDAREFYVGLVSELKEKGL